MKKLLLLSALLCVTFGSARAQLSNTITSKLHDQTFSMGREFWFAAPSNNWGPSSGPEILQICITSPKNTIVYVDLGGTISNVIVTAYAVSIFTIPNSWEMESSGIVENKAIHVYSNDADLSVCFWSHQDYLGEGSYIIPTIGWGTDYVVAAYASLFEGSGTTYYDFPSECVIVAEEDNTSVEITPSCDCRTCTSGNQYPNADASIVAFPAGQQHEFQLSRGQSLQLMPVLATGPDNFDMTGTIIHANNPVGVIGASSETNIPLDVPYANFICEMIPPVRTWGKTYYATNFTEPASAAGNALYLFVASQPEQTISRYDCNSGSQTAAVIGNQYGVSWGEIEGAQKFSSNAPFLVVTYMNEAIYNGKTAWGHPAEVEINPREQYTRTEMFQALQTPSSQHLGFVNYANVIVNDSDEKKTLFDGKSIAGNGKQCIDGNWEIFLVPTISEGTHTVTGDDSGVGVYLYAYGNDETYAWSTSGFQGTFHSPDSAAPRADTETECYEASIRVSDFGNLPDSLGPQSGLAEIRLDSVQNMTYVRDANFIDGIETDSSQYSLSVIDPTKPGILVVTAFDYAGNSTTITSTYTPNIIAISPPLQNLGVWIAGEPKIAYDTIINEGQTIFDISTLKLKYGNVGFTLFDSTGGPLDLSPLAPGERRIIQIKFEAVKTTLEVDSILYGNACELQAVAVIGSGGANDFLVTSQTWPDEPLGNCYPKTVTIENLSSTAITVDSAWWADTIHFKAASGQFPVSVPASPGNAAFTIDYCPDSNSAIIPDRTLGIWFSPEVLESGLESPRFDSLTGWAAPLSGVDETNFASEATILPMSDGRSLEIILPAGMSGSFSFELVNVLGQSVLRQTFGAGTQTVDASSLPRGVYFYRLTSGSINQNGKVILGE